MVKNPPPSKGMRQLMECYERKDREKLKLADLGSQCNSSRKSSRPSPRFRMDQSFHHFWAKWMAHATAPPKQINKKVGRPAWYNDQVNTKPIWGTSTYGGVPPFEDWRYHAH